jgi:hypothetical protein
MIISSETSVLTRAIPRNIPGYGILLITIILCKVVEFVPVIRAVRDFLSFVFHLLEFIGSFLWDYTNIRMEARIMSGLAHFAVCI